jgi:hypothetical protein
VEVTRVVIMSIKRPKKAEFKERTLREMGFLLKKKEKEKKTRL